MSNPNIWSPGTAITAESSVKSQAFTSSANQTDFTLTSFTYELGTGSLYIYVSGLMQRPGVDFFETGSSTFRLDTPVAAGTVVLAVAMVEVSANLDATNNTIATFYTAAGGETLVSTGTSYVVGSNNLYVFKNGLLQKSVDDYAQTSGSTVTFIDPLDADDRIMFMTNVFVSSSEDAALRTDLAASGGSDLVGFQAAGAGASTRNVQEKLREIVSVLDFGASNDGTNAATTTAAIRAAIIAAAGKAVYFPKGTYSVNAPIFTEAEVTAGTYGATVTLLGEASNNVSVAAALTQISLADNASYFSAFGYNLRINNIAFIDGVDVIHHSSQNLDANQVKLTDVTALGFTGTFFKGFGFGNGTHMTWDRPVIISNNATAVVFDDTPFGTEGFDNLTINDGWIETASTTGFKCNSGRTTVNGTRFIPYTQANSLWWDFGGGYISFCDTDFGGESSRRILDVQTGVDSVSFTRSGLFGVAGIVAINLIGAPSTIMFQDISTDVGAGGSEILYVNPTMTAADLRALSSTEITLNGTPYNFDEALFATSGVSTKYGFALAATNQLAPSKATLTIDDLLANGGFPWVTTASTTNTTVTNGPTDLYGTDTWGYKLVLTADTGGYFYFNNGPGVSTIPDGAATLTALVTVTGDPVKIILFFGGNAANLAHSKTFYLSAGTHLICFPLYFTSTMTRNLGFSYQGKNGTEIKVTRLRAFKGLFTDIAPAFYGTAAPTSAAVIWYAGDRVVNSVPTVGQPKAWVCTVAGTPGTWVSEGNL